MTTARAAYPIAEERPRLTLIYSASRDLSEQQKLRRAKTADGPLPFRNPQIKKTILLVEDQESFRMIFRDALEHAGYTVIEAEDGVEGLELAKLKKPDLVLLDLMLPKLHGFKVLEKIKSDQRTKEVNVIILSVLDDKASQEQGKHLGADAFMVKSHLSVQKMLSAIESIFKKNR